MISKTNPSILTIKAKYFPYNAPETYDFDIVEIAHSLARLCRFTGHVDCPGIYSVAQHSVLVSLIVPEPLRVAALLHDSAEAYMGDVNAPLKQLLPDYKAIEKRVERAIFKYFELQWPKPKAIKQADTRLLAAERRDFQPMTREKWEILDGVEPFPATGITPMDPKEAYEYFMYHWELYNDLSITRQNSINHRNQKQ